MLPGTDVDLDSWLVSARPKVEAFFSCKGWRCTKQLGRVLSRIRKGGAEQVADFVGQTGIELPFAVKTIHGVKGESYDAVLVVGSPVLKKDAESDVRGWFSMNARMEVRVESVRRAYVAMSRARKLLAIAVPRSAWLCARQSMKRFRFVDFSHESPREVLLANTLLQERELGPDSAFVSEAEPKAAEDR